jgi:hypothetical protein
VDREIKENHSTANMRGRWLSACRSPTRSYFNRAVLAIGRLQTRR